MNYHFTKMKFLEFILKEGLIPQNGINCEILSDIKTKISYSIGSDGATRMFGALYEIYYRFTDEPYGFLSSKNQIKLKSNYETGMTEGKDIRQCFEEWEEEGVYLCFDDEAITGSKSEIKPHDASTDQTISSDKLKVCVIRKRNSEEITYSKFDIVCFWIAKNNSHKNYAKWFSMDYENKINQFANNEYYLDYVELDKFCEQYLGLQNDSLVQTVTPADIAETDINRQLTPQEIKKSKKLIEIIMDKIFHRG